MSRSIDAGRIKELIRDLGHDRTVVLSTHILVEVEATCTQAIIIHEGRIAAAGTLDEVRTRAAGGVRYRVELSGDGVVEQTAALPEVERVEPRGDVGGFHNLIIYAPEDPRTVVANLASRRGWRIRAMEREIPDLEEAFLAVVGREDRRHS